MIKLLFRTAAPLLPILVLATACASPPTNFYTLAPVASETAALVPPGSGGRVIGVGPVRVANYLDRAEIVVRRSAYAVDLATFDQWAEPLDDRVPQVLIEDLSTRLPGDQVIAFPALVAIPVDVQVQVNVVQFDVDTTGRTVLIADWRLFGPGGRPSLAAGRSQATATAADASYAARVAALSQTLADFSGDLAAALSVVPPARSAPRPLATGR